MNKIVRPPGNKSRPMCRCEESSARNRVIYGFTISVYAKGGQRLLKVMFTLKSSQFQSMVTCGKRTGRDTVTLLQMTLVRDVFRCHNTEMYRFNYAPNREHVWIIEVPETQTVRVSWIFRDRRHILHLTRI